MSEALFHHPVEVVLVLVVIIFISPIIMKKLKAPALVGMLILGIIIGPYGLHVIDITESILLLAEIGLLYIMYVAGLEIDLKQFMKVKEKAILFGILSIIFPWTLGFITAMMFGMSVVAGILLGIIISSHTLIAYPIISELGVADDEAVVITVGGTIITDLTALIGLAIIIGQNKEGGASLLDFAEFFGLFALYVVFMLFIVPRVVSYLFKRDLHEDEEFMLTLVVLFLAAFLAELIELEAIIGAFFAGLAINRLIPKHSRLMQKLEFFGRVFFIPVFIIYIGMLVNVGVVISSARVILLALSLIVSLFVGKYLASYIVGRIFEYDRSRVLTMYSLAIPQVGVTLATILVGVNIGILELEVLNAGILLMMITSSIPPIMTSKYAKDLGELALGEDEEVEHVTSKVMVPVTAETADSNIIDLAGIFVQQSKGHFYPIHISKPMKSGMPVDENDRDKPDKILEKSVEMANDLDIEVTPMHRVHTDTLEGILNGIEETKASMLLTEWIDDKDVPTRSFSELIDRLVEKSPIPIAISRFSHPLNVIPKTIIILRDYDLRSNYLHDLLSITKNLSSTLKNDLIVVNASHVNILDEKQVEKVKPERPFEYKYTEGSLKPLEAIIGKEDLLIATLPPYFSVQSGGFSSILTNDLGKLARKLKTTIVLFKFPKKRLTVNTSTE